MAAFWPLMTIQTHMQHPLLFPSPVNILEAANDYGVGQARAKQPLVQHPSEIFWVELIDFVAACLLQQHGECTDGLLLPKAAITPQ